MIKALEKFTSKAKIDKAVAFTILARVISGFSGLGSVFLITRYLSTDEQGYYYTFASILAIQVFFELGLTNILTQYTAYEYAHLTLSNNTLAGDSYYKSRLSSLLHFCFKWFGALSVVLFFILIIAGFTFFSSYNKGLNVEWKTPWIILSLATSCNLFIDPILAYFDGLGYIEDISKVRLLQKTVNAILLFVFLISGFKLYSAALASLIAIIINYLQILLSGKRSIIISIWKEKNKDVINYYKEIFPYQWRIALSWISGYFIFQLFNPILFATEGAKVAGQMGITMQVLNGIAALGMSWISTKIPLFSTLISKKSYKELDNEFDAVFKSLVLANCFFLLVFALIVTILSYYFPEVRVRFLPTLSLVCLSLTVIIGQVISSWAIYLRCHKKEPLLVQALVSAVYCTFSTIIFGKIFGLNGIVISYTIWSVISYFWVDRIFTTKKLEWHLT